MRILWGVSKAVAQVLSGVTSGVTHHFCTCEYYGACPSLAKSPNLWYLRKVLSGVTHLGPFTEGMTSLLA